MDLQSTYTMPKATTQGLSAENVSVQASSTERSSPQIAWLQHTGEQRGLVGRLARRFDESGLAPGITSYDLSRGGEFPEFDLLLVEYTRSNLRDLAHMVREIRCRSSAPVIVLVRSELADLTVAALGAGADLVLPLNTAEVVIAARCRALLRRWCSNLN